jgi:hypothetical protein
MSGQGVLSGLVLDRTIQSARAAAHGFPNAAAIIMASTKAEMQPSRDRLICDKS